MTTRSELVSQVEAIIDRSDVETRIQTAITTVLDRIGRQYDFSYLMGEDTSTVTVASQFTYALPSSTNRIYRIVYEDGSNSRDLMEIYTGEFDRKYPYPSSLGDGEPCVYCRRTNTSIDICPPPATADKVLRIARSVHHPELTSDSSTLYYSNMDDVIVAGIVSEMYHQLGVYDEADSWNKKFQTELKEAYRKDQEYPHRIFNPQLYGWSGGYIGDYWKNPFYKG